MEHIKLNVKNGKKRIIPITKNELDLLIEGLKDDIVLTRDDPENDITNRIRESLIKRLEN